MSTATLLWTMAACGLVTFLIRLSFIAFGHRLPDDPRIAAVLRYVPPAVLGALIAPEIVAQGGQLDLNPRKTPASGPHYSPCSPPDLRAACWRRLRWACWRCGGCK